MIRLYNLCRDTPNMDDNYVLLNLKMGKHIKTIKFIDHRKTCPDVYAQGDIGSCASGALCCIFYHNLVEFGYSNVFYPSRLFVYYNIRLMKHTVNTDNGGSIRDALKALFAYGACPEQMWDYKIENFAVAPPLEAYDYGRLNRSIIYARVRQNIIHLQQCLLDGYLFAFGMSVYSNFESEETESTGIVKMPEETDVYKGGHAVCAVGFDDDKKVFIVRNSWGDKWGDHGYFYLPYEYIINPELVYDIWTFRNGKDLTMITENLPCKKKCIIL